MKHLLDQQASPNNFSIAYFIHSTMTLIDRHTKIPPLGVLFLLIRGQILGGVKTLSLRLFLSDYTNL